MGMKSVFDNLKNKMMESPGYQEKFQQAWQVHAAVFGPILEPAFADNMEARTHLVAALNQIQRNDCEKGLQTLRNVEKHVKNNADMAALLYFIGLAHERGGDKNVAIDAYMRANALEHDFFLSYFTVARDAHMNLELDLAEKNYRETIRCLELHAMPGDLLARAYANLASCLTFMHRCEEAEHALERSVELLPVLPGRANTAAVLAAAQGKRERVAEELAELKADNHPSYESAVQLTDSILEGTHPHFVPVEVWDDAIIAFWEWFCKNERTLYNLVRNQNDQRLSELLDEQLYPVFRSMSRNFSFGVSAHGEVYTVNLCDHYSIGSRGILDRMMALCPDPMPARWDFRIIHTLHDPQYK